MYNNLNIAGSIAGYALTQINSLIYNAITTLQNNVILNSLTTIGTSIMQAGLSVIGTLAVTGNLTFSSAVSMPGYMCAAGLVSAAGTKMSGTGQMSWTVSRVSTGIYSITWGTAHPLGANHIVNVSAQSALSMVRQTVSPTSTSFQVVVYTIGTTSIYRWRI